MIFNSTKTESSKTCEGVTFTYRVMTEGVRSQLDFKLADTMAQIRAIQVELASIDLPTKEDGTVDTTVKLPLAQMIRVNELSDQLARLRRSKVNPEYFQQCFVRVEHLDIDGVPDLPGEGHDVGPITSPEKIRDFGPPELYQEIVSAIVGESRASTSEKEVLESPTISAAQVDGQTPNSNADSANETNSTSTETVTSTSPSE